MTGRGRSASLPPVGWRPPAQRHGLRVEFVSEDGRQRKTFDFAVLPGNPQIREEFARLSAKRPARWAVGGEWDRRTGCGPLFASRVDGWLKAART
jgi:hypothetical protein